MGRRKGCKQSEETKEKIRQKLIGHSISEETRKKIGDGNRGKKVSDDAKQKIRKYRLGKTLSEESKKLVSDNNICYWKGKHLSEEHKQKISDANKGRIKSETEKEKLRICRLNCVTPNFNPKACQIIDEYGKTNGYNFQHALNGGEIRIIGYSLDGYDKDKNSAIEYYEKWHKKPNQVKKDECRKHKIMEALGCKFIELREE